MSGFAQTNFQAMIPGGGSGYDAVGESPARSIIAFPTNSYIEISSLARKTIVQKSRALAANLPLVRRIVSKIAQHAVGKGIFVKPTTQDREWNVLAQKAFENWASNPSVYSIDASRDHYEDQLLAAETIPLDGEYFAALVESPNGAPMVQPLDVFEIDQPLIGRGEYENFHDGVRLNKFGRPILYLVEEMKPGWSRHTPTYRKVMAMDMLHVYKRHRAKQTRGLPWLFSGINQGIDALDLRALITGTAKLHSGLAVSVKGGGAPNKMGALGAIDKRSGVAPNDVSALERIYGGGMINYLSESGEIKLHASDHPGENLIEFLKFLYADIALAFNLPLEVVYSLAPLGGVSARGSLEDAQWLFDMLQDKIFYRHTYPIYLWRIARLVQEGRLRPCKDPQWWACTYRGPAKLTADAGRTADATVKLIKNGLLSHTRYFEQLGLDAREEIEEQIDLLAWAQERCEARGVSFNKLMESTPGASTQEESNSSKE